DATAQAGAAGPDLVQGAGRDGGDVLHHAGQRSARRAVGGTASHVVAIAAARLHHDKYDNDDDDGEDGPARDQQPVALLAPALHRALRGDALAAVNVSLCPRRLAHAGKPRGFPWLSCSCAAERYLCATWRFSNPGIWARFPYAGPRDGSEG